MDIHWFPGHMAKALREMNEKLKVIDLIIEIIDARAPYSSRNPNLEEINKPRLIIMSKIDLADEKKTKEWVSYFKKEQVSVIGMDFINNFNMKIIEKEAYLLMREKLEKEMAKGMKKRPLRAMVVGIPNVGKSTFINKMAKRKATRVANTPGYTKGQQWVKTESIELLDTPGVLWPKFENKEVGIKLALIGTIKDEILSKDELSLLASKFLVEKYPDVLKKAYQLSSFDNIFSDIADFRKLVINEGQLDLKKAQAVLLKEFKDGIIGRFTLESPGADDGFFRV